MKYILQISTGSWNTLNVRPDSVIRKISRIASRIPVGKVIIGWNPDPSLYTEVGAFLREAGIGMLLWLPVFAESGGAAVPDPALDLFGRKFAGVVSQKGDDFDFCCPSSPRNIQNVKDLYEKYFSGCGFDGVFLDRIRSRSFTAGVSGVLSCGCGRCREAFRKKGVVPEEVRVLWEEKQDAFFDMVSFPMDGSFWLADKSAQKFFEAKEEIIADAVAGLCRYFRDRGLVVGLDLFAPLVSRFVGQNYSLITKEADFIKPMLYRRTEAPAGIGYEYALFTKHAPGAGGVPPVTMDREFLDTQLDAAGRVSCEKYPGIEVNYAEGIVETDPAYITESLSAVMDHGFEGAVLCWDVMSAPETHLRAVEEMERSRNP